MDSVILAGAIETEHHEIAAYENLIIHAQALGYQEAAELLQRNLVEEQSALETVTTLATLLAASESKQPAHSR